MYMTSIDIRDAYYCLKIHKKHRKYVRFEWNNKLFQFTALGQGLSSAPRLFSKILKIPLIELRKLGINIIHYFDDILILGDTKEQCLEHTKQAIELLSNLGFVINYDKSQLTPVQKIEHLGLIIDSLSMTVKLTDSKIHNIKTLCQEALSVKQFTIRHAATICGTMVSYIYGAEFGKLYYRGLEKCKNFALARSKGNFEALMTIDFNAIRDLTWWLNNVNNQVSLLMRPEPSISITSDSSKVAWGCHNDEGIKTGGFWDNTEVQEHINVLETKAILLSLQTFCDKCVNTHIRVHTDSGTALSYVNNMGGLVSQKCHDLAIKIWEWAISKGNYVSCVYISTKDNTADILSRNQNNSSEWSLDTSTFYKILSHFHVEPTIDLFATRINCKLNRYVSYQPDPGAIFCDALQYFVGKEIFYAFPPIKLISKFLKKIEIEKSEGIIIVPMWPSQPFFTPLIKLLVDIPIKLKWHNDLISNPVRETHNLGKKLKLIGCHISGDIFKRRAFLKKLQKSCFTAGHRQHINNIQITFTNGRLTVTGGNSVILKAI